MGGDNLFESDWSCPVLYARSTNLSLFAVGSGGDLDRVASYSIRNAPRSDYGGSENVDAVGFDPGVGRKGRIRTPFALTSRG
jgi:hypothetical protein